MQLFQPYENYPTPIILVDKNGFLVAKNYMAGITFGLHIGTKLSAYTNINYTKEAISQGIFCDKKCTYLVTSVIIDDIPYSLVILSVASFGQAFLPESALDNYKKAIKEMDANDTLDRNKERRYIRAVHNNLVRVNLFDAFINLFDTKFKRQKEKEEFPCQTSVSSVCYAVHTAAENFLTGASIGLDIDYETPSLLANIPERELITIIVNALFFGVMNSTSGVEMHLSLCDGDAELKVSFTAVSLFEEFFKDTASATNSYMSLAIAFELADAYGAKYALITSDDGKSEIIFKIPVVSSGNISFSSQNSAYELAEKLISRIFFDD